MILHVQVWDQGGGGGGGVKNIANFDFTELLETVLACMNLKPWSNELDFSQYNMQHL